MRIISRGLICVGALFGLSANNENQTSEEINSTRWGKSLAVNVFTPEGKQDSTFNNGKGFVLDARMGRCTALGARHFRNAPNSSGVIYVGGSCRLDEDDNFGLISFNTTFGQLDTGLYGQGWGTVYRYPPYDNDRYLRYAKNMQLDDTKRAHFFGSFRMSEAEGSRSPLFIERLTTKSFPDDDFGLEGIHTLPAEGFPSRGHLMEDGRTVVARQREGSDILGLHMYVRGEADSQSKYLHLFENQVLSPFDFSSDENGNLYALFRFDKKGDDRLSVIKLNKQVDGLDQTFGNEGIVELNFDKLSLRGNRIVWKNDKLYVLAHHRTKGPNDITHALLAVLNDDGTLDESFSGDGKRLLYFANYASGSEAPTFDDIAVSASGTIFLAGTHQKKLALLSIDKAGDNRIFFGDGTFRDRGLVLSDNFKLPEPHHTFIRVTSPTIDIDPATGKIYIGASVEYE